ncbi:Ig-like domain-containing protein, partial [Leptospira gomenensis]
MNLRKRQIKITFLPFRFLTGLLLVFAGWGCLLDRNSSLPGFSFYIPTYLSLSPSSSLSPSALAINGGKSLRGGIVFPEIISDPIFSRGFNLRLAIGTEHSGSVLYACIDLPSCISSSSFFQRSLGEITAAETELNFFFPVETYPSEGTHTLYISIVKDSRITKQISNPLVFDSTPPTLSPSLGAGIYTSTGTLSFNCTDALSGCDSIVFTSTSTDPSVAFSANFDPFSVLNGNVYSSSIPISSGITTIRALAVDRSGNVSNVEEWGYEVNLTGPILPAADLTEVQDSPVNSSGSATLVWEANVGGTFQIADDSQDCSTLTAPEVLLSGTAASGTQNTSIAHSILTEGDNSLKLCFKDALNQYDSFLFSVTKDTTRPTVVSSSPSAGAINADITNEHLLLTFDEAMAANTAVQVRAFLTYGPVGTETTVELSLPAGARSWGSTTLLDVDLD